MKGVILSINPDARIVDVTHGLRSFEIARAAFAIKNSYGFFPEGSVHLAVVDPVVGTGRKPLAIEAGGNFFVGPDNGIFSSVFQAFPSFSAHAIENPEYTLKGTGSTFHGRDIFAPAAAHLSLGVSPSEMGTPVEKPVLTDTAEPVFFGGETVEGVCVYTDHFGNMISNIKSDGVPEKTEIEISGFTIEGISDCYADREPGETVAVRGSSGFIEIAVNRASARERFGGEGTKIILRKKQSGKT